MQWTCVHLSKVGVPSKQLNVGSCKQCGTISHGSSFVTSKISGKFNWGHPNKPPALVAEWLTHSAAMCSRAWRAQWPGFNSARARPPTKELFLIIPTHMMNREIIPGRKKEGSTVSSINCDRCRQLDLAVSSLPAAPAWVDANRLGWPLVGVIHGASQG